MKIILLDDHNLFGESLKALALNKSRVEEFSFTSSVDEFWNKISCKDYDIALVDINLGGDLTGLDILKQLKDKYPSQKAAVLSSYKQVAFINQAIENGASGYYTKDISIDDLLNSLENIINNNVKMNIEKKFLQIGNLRLYKLCLQGRIKQRSPRNYS